MKVTNFFCLFFLFQICFVFGQQEQLNKFDTYLFHLRNAEDLYYSSDFKKALKEYEIALDYKNDNQEVSFIFFEKADCYFKLNKEKKAIVELRNAIIYCATKEQFENGYVIGDSLAAKSWEKIKDNYIDLRRKYYGQLKNPDVYLEVENLMAIDQFGRRFSSFEDEIDNDNITKFIEIVKEHGWQQNGWVLLWHHRDTYKQDNEVWNFFLPFFENEIKIGNLPKSYLAWFEDYTSWEKTGFTIYGAFPAGKVNKETVNVKRKEINLKPLTEEQINEKNK